MHMFQEKKWRTLVGSAVAIHCSQRMAGCGDGGALGRGPSPTGCVQRGMQREEGRQAGRKEGLIPD